MSARALKKLYGNDLGVGDELEEEESSVSHKSRTANLFSALLDDESTRDEENSDEASSETELPVKADATEVAKQYTTPEGVSSKSSKKSKNKKKKKKTSPNATDNQDIDKILEELKIDRTPQNHVSEKPKSIFEVTVKNLNYENEFKKLFGNAALKDLDEESSPEIAQMKRRMQNSRVSFLGKGGDRNIPLMSRKLVLAKVKSQFPLIAERALKMKRTDDVLVGQSYFKCEFPSSCFKYVCSESYSEAEKVFQTAIAMHDFDAIMAIAERSIHVGSLIVISDKAMASNQRSTASDCLELCLLAFDWGFDTNYRFDGYCRVPYKYPLNRQFYIVIFKYIRLLMARNTWVTALEFTKLLCSLEPETDPLGIFYMIDFFCLNAGAYKYLLSLGNALPDLPTVKYSMVVALLELKKPEQEIKNQVRSAIETSPAIAALLIKVLRPEMSVLLPPVYHRVLEDDLVSSIIAQVYVGQNKLLWSKSAMDYLINECISLSDFNLPDDISTEIPINLQRYIVLAEHKHLYSYISDYGSWAHDPFPPSDSVHDT